MGITTDERTRPCVELDSQPPAHRGVLPASLPLCLSMEWQIIEREGFTLFMSVIWNI